MHPAPRPRSHHRIPALPPRSGCRVCGFGKADLCAQHASEVVAVAEVIPSCGCGRPLYAPGYRAIWEIRQSPICSRCQTLVNPPRRMTVEEEIEMSRSMDEDVQRMLRRF